MSIVCMGRWIKRIFIGLAALLVLAAGGGAAYQWYASRADLAATPPPGRMVDIGGRRIHLWCMGSGSPTVILDSGLGGTAFSWPTIQPEVAEFTQVCSWDRAGMGYSDPGPSPRTSRRIANELAAVLERGGIGGPVVLVGFSFGGFNARMFAAGHGEMTAGLVLVAASHEDQGQRYAEAGIPSSLPPYAPLVRVAAPLGVLRLMGVSLGPPPDRADPSVREFVRATAFRTSRYQAMSDELSHTQDSGAELRESRRQLSIPLVVLSAGKGSGPRAEINRELQRDLLTLSSRACQVIAGKSGHDIVGSEPELVVEAVRAVIEAAGDDSSRPGC